MQNTKMKKRVESIKSSKQFSFTPKQMLWLKPNLLWWKLSKLSWQKRAWWKPDELWNLKTHATDIVWCLGVVAISSHWIRLFVSAFIFSNKRLHALKLKVTHFPGRLGHTIFWNLIDNLISSLVLWLDWD